MREESLKYGTSKKKELANREEETESVITTLGKRLPEFNGELETMIKYRTKGATLMSVNLNGTRNVRKTLNTFSI